MSNCKAGDLAVVVATIPTEQQLLGRIVRCLQISPHPNLFGSDLSTIIYSGAIWEVETAQGVRCIPGIKVFGVPDAWLRPIRDQDGEDEMITRVGKPEGVTA